MSILKKINPFTKQFFTEILPAIELPNFVIAALLAALLYIPFDLIIQNRNNFATIQDTFYRMDTCLNVISSKVSDKCVQGEVLSAAAGENVKFIAYTTKVGNELNYEITTSYLLTDALKEEIIEYFNNAENYHTVSMLKEEDCPNQEKVLKAKRKKCQVFSNYNIVQDTDTNYIVLYNKETIKNNMKELSLYFSSAF